MKFLKKGAIILLILLIPMMAFAAKDIMDINYMEDTPGSDFNLITFVKTLINWYFYALLVVALFLLIKVGYDHVVSGGDSKKAGKAAATLGYILMGIAIALIAKGLIYAACFIVTSSGTVCAFW